MLKALKAKDMSDTYWFDSRWSAGVNCHCENQYSSEEDGEESEEYSDYDPESDSAIESEVSHVSDNDEDDSLPDLQEILDEPEIYSDD